MFIIQCVNREKGGDILALEAITQIKNVEAEADNIIKDATVKAKQRGLCQFRKSQGTG